MVLYVFTVNSRLLKVESRFCSEFGSPLLFDSLKRSSTRDNELKHKLFSSTELQLSQNIIMIIRSFKNI